MSVVAPSVMINRHDGRKFQESHSSDPSIPFDTEGGWVLSRPRFTRRPPVTYTLGFTDLSDAEKTVLQTLYNDVRGSSDTITGWVHPISSAVLTVRFKRGAIPQYIYRGNGNNPRWDVTAFIIEEV